MANATIKLANGTTFTGTVDECIAFVNAQNSKAPKQTTKGDEAPRNPKAKTTVAKATSTKKSTATATKKANAIPEITLTVKGKTVTANKYLPNELYKQNEIIIEQLNGTIVKGVGEFRAEFKSVANARAFVEQAVTSISKKEYNATRKKATSTAKGNTKSKKATAPKKSTKGSKGKGKKQLTEKQKRSMAYEQTCEYYGNRRVKHDTFMKRMNAIMEEL